MNLDLNIYASFQLEITQQVLLVRWDVISDALTNGVEEVSYGNMILIGGLNRDGFHLQFGVGHMIFVVDTV